MSNLHQYYILFLSSLDEFEPRDNFLNQSRKPKISDKALIALNLDAESTSIDRDLFECSAISLETPMRSNQIDKKPFPKVFRKARKRIETLFSQPCDQFMIRRNYAKSFAGFST